MKNAKTALALAIALALPVSSAFAERVVLKAKGGLPKAQKEALAKSVGGKVVKEIPQIGLTVLELPPQASAKATAALLKRDKRVEFAEVDELVAHDLAVNDPSLGSQWALAKIAAPLAWDTAQGEGQIIAVLDTGVLSTHPDLAGKIVPGWNIASNSADTSDIQGHGTLVSGVAAATSNNGVGIAGTAGAAKIMPMRITDDPTGYAYFSSIASGLTWAADHGATVANASYGVAGSASVQSAAAYLRSKGGNFFCSAMNNNKDEGFAPNDNIMAVSATDSNDAKASFSSFGAFVDVAAPGVSLLTTNRSGTYSNASGTSFSAPTTAGVAALVKSANPALSPADVDDIIKSTAKDLGAAGVDIYFGSGRVDAAAAVAKAKLATPTDSIAPAVSFASPANGSAATGLVDVAINASDNVGVAKVELYAKGSLVGTDFDAPYGFMWDSASVADGAATLTAKAYDAKGNSASASVSVTAKNGPVDSIAPVAAISSPANGSVLSGSKATVKASATDNVGVVSLSLSIDGKVVARSSSGSISYSWNLRKVAKGAHAISVEALDAAGNSGKASVSVTR